MRISTSLKHDVWHDLKEGGSYEWWYFDAIDEKNDLSIVAIWFCGFPFSPYYIQRYNKWVDHGKNGKSFPNPLEHTAFSFNMYYKGKEVINFIKEGDASLFKSSKDTPYAKFENNFFYYDEKENCYVLEFDFQMPARRKQVKGRIVFSISQFDQNYDISDYSYGQSEHSWILVSPKANTSGEIVMFDGIKNKLQKYKFDGRGYHDHNYGRLPMNTDIEKWYWGRAHSKDLDIVYYIITYKSQAQAPFAFLMAVEKDKMIVLDNSFNMLENGHQRNFFVPPYSKELTLSNEAITFNITHDNGLDIGPFYLRFNSTFKLKTKEGIDISLSGISEFLNPGSIDSTFVLGLIKSKIWRQGNHSLMYNLYNFVFRFME